MNSSDPNLVILRIHADREKAIHGLSVGITMCLGAWVWTAFSSINIVVVIVLLLGLLICGGGLLQLRSLSAEERTARAQIS
jgi:hypothetical protein